MQYQVSARWKTALGHQIRRADLLSEDSEQHVYTQLENGHSHRDDRDYDQGQSANMQILGSMVAVVMNKSH